MLAAALVAVCMCVCVGGGGGVCMSALSDKDTKYGWVRVMPLVT